MSVHPTAVVAALLLGTAVLVWPRPRFPSAALADLDPASRSRERAAKGADGLSSGSSLWHEDPVELFRRWRLRRRPGVLVDDVLELLRGIGPALEAGLAPARAIELASVSTLGAERVARARELVRQPRRRSRARTTPWPRAELPAGDGRSRVRSVVPAGAGPAEGHASSRPVADIDRLVGALLEASERAEPTSPIWTEWAARSASAELALVAAAWRLSETTGAPLASAVDRSVHGLLDARARRGKVSVAVAGPRATVTVLTLLPLTGPLFGLACGVDPASLYLGSPVATACAVVGLGLVWTGRVWCSHMVRRAVAS